MENERRVFVGREIIYISIILLLLVVNILLGRGLMGGVTLVSDAKFIPYQPDPIRAAIFYDSKSKRFEEIVGSNKSWVNINEVGEDGELSPSVLAICAESKDEEKVKILLLQGADQDVAMSWLGRQGDVESIAFIKDASRSLTEGVSP